MPRISPNPLTYTIRLKHHKTTVLLVADPLQTLSSLKAELLAALQETIPDAQLNGRELPESADELVLGKPVDIFDGSKGWMSLEPDEDNTMDDEVGSGRRKKASKGGESLKALGLKDNAVLAFKWGEEEETGKGKQKKDNEDELDVEIEDEEWDVIIPSYEDVYGVENEGDIGGLKEFTG